MPYSFPTRRRMPPANRRYRNPTRFPLYRRPTTVRSLGPRMLSRMRFVAANTDMEKKYVVTTGTQAYFFYDASTGGVSGLEPVFLNGPPQGDNPSARNGNSIRSYSVDVDYFIQRGTNYNAPVRIMLVMDRQPESAQVSLANIIDDVTAGDSIVAGLNPANQRRFWILADKRHLLDTYHIEARGHIFKRIRFRVRFSGSSGGYNNCVTGGLWLIFISTTKDTSTTTNNPAVTFRAKYKFLDN